MNNYDSYIYVTKVEQNLFNEVNEMEANSTWMHDIDTNSIKIESIDGPIFVEDVSKKYQIDYDVLYETTQNTGLLIKNIKYKTYCVRDTAKTGLSNAAKLFGSALGRMAKNIYAETINNGLNVAKGKSILLLRNNKISGIHSSQYEIMPISKLLNICKEKISEKFGQIKFIAGENTNDHTSALWELPQYADELNKKYEEIINKTMGSPLHPVAYTPAIRFMSSDTATSSAIVVPLFKTYKGTYFRFVDGIQVRHEKRNKTTGLEIFEKEIEQIFSKFNESFEKIEELTKITIYNSSNCVVELCNKFKIPKKYGDCVRGLIEQFGSPVTNAHEIYLTFIGMLSIVDAKQSVLIELEETIAKFLTINDWSEFDIGGLVAWK